MRPVVIAFMRRARAFLAPRWLRKGSIMHASGLADDQVRSRRLHDLLRHYLQCVGFENAFPFEFAVDEEPSSA
jgi:hypothetical protein